MALEVGETLDTKYRIVRVIGVGGMGTVYEGEHTLILRRVAIKVLGEDSAQTPDSVRRFEREAQAAGQIGNDHILEVLDVGNTVDGHRYMVMEYLDGETLARRIERVGRMTPAQIAPLARQMLAGLAAAHDAGIVHRDLKPDNVFILREKAGLRDFVKIIDFGISKFDQLGEIPSRLTQSGAVLGTPVYMSPEQARGAAVDLRSDLHACGVILFEAVTGRVPFEGQNFNELMFQIALDKRPRPRDFVPGIDPRFEAIVVKAMLRDPAKRYQSAQEFAKDLEGWMRANSISTTTGEIALSDLAPLLPPPSRAPHFDPRAVTVQAEADGLGARRTVTNATMDTLAPTGRRNRWRWIAVGLGAGSGLALAAAALLMRHPTAPATADAVPGSLAAAVSQVATTASASAPATTTALAASKAPTAPQAVTDGGGAHAQDPHHVTKPPKGGPHPAPTGKQVDFGY